MQLMWGEACAPTHAASADSPHLEAQPLSHTSPPHATSFRAKHCNAPFTPFA